MSRLYGAVASLILVWSISMSFFALSAYLGDWVWAVVGAGFFFVFVALGGLLIPPARAAVPEADRKTAFWFLQFLGAFVTMELLIAALFAWIMGNRTHSASTAYQVLGLLIFLAMLGLGVQGVLATSSFFLRQHNLRTIERRAAHAQQVAHGH